MLLVHEIRKNLDTDLEAYNNYEENIFKKLLAFKKEIFL